MEHLLFSSARLQVARLAVVLATLIVAALSPAAQAQSVRYISLSGNDTKACTFTAPCRTLARGVAVAPVRGEVRLLNSGSFGAGVTIAKTLTLSGNGNTLILTGPITVSASGSRVVFRDLLLTGLGTVSNGIVVTAAASVHVVGCEVERFTDDGFLVESAGAVEIFVTDSIFRNNGDDGMRVDGSGTTRVTVDRSRFENNVDRGVTIENAQSSLTRSTFSGNGGDGLAAAGGTLSIAWSTAASNGSSGFAILFDGEMQLESSVSRGNANAGLFLSSSSSASISNMTVTNNNFGIFSSGTVRTRQNNRVFGNSTDFDGNAPTPLGGT